MVATALSLEQLHLRPSEDEIYFSISTALLEIKGALDITFYYYQSYENTDQYSVAGEGCLTKLRSSLKDVSFLITQFSNNQDLLAHYLSNKPQHLNYYNLIFFSFNRLLTYLDLSYGRYREDPWIDRVLLILEMFSKQIAMLELLELQSNSYFSLFVSSAVATAC